MSAFTPPALLRNPHAQTLLASTAPRKLPLLWRTRGFRAAAGDVVLDCSGDVRLHGFFNPRGGEKLAILLHGWEGSGNSPYLLSNAQTLYNAGFSVFRLHLRDHGPSHALNRELYHSARLQEVVDAVAEIQRRFPHERTFLAGHSLGGNFALRVAARAPAAGISLERVVTICPVLEPAHTMQRLMEGSFIYHQYFLRRWKKSLSLKLQHFPDLGYGSDLLKLHSLEAMNNYFVPRFTEFAAVDRYFDAYAVTGDTLAGLAVPTHIILSLDDPMIPAVDLPKLAQSPCLTLETPQHGGHCGFIQNWRFTGWIDQRLRELMA
ncbi:YheT family hydrolase [Haliea sp. E17]|uniref:YheT family hydrolase n=1 Tax=Haliea sp. E17 TaxID=3401576 RepID=UPI003AB06E86